MAESRNSTTQSIRNTQHASSGIPGPFLERMARLLGDEYPAFLASYDAAPSVGLRVNTLKIAPRRSGSRRRSI